MINYLWNHYLIVNPRHLLIFFCLLRDSHHHKKSRKYVANGDSNKPRRVSTNEEPDEDSYQIILQLEEPLQEFVQDDVTSKKFFNLLNVL